MMTWNFRLVKHIERKPRRVWYGVHEVFYNDAGRPWTMTKEPIRLDGESAQEVQRYLDMVRRDLKRLPALDAQRTKWARCPIRYVKPSKLISLEQLKRKLDL